MGMYAGKSVGTFPFDTGQWWVDDRGDFNQADGLDRSFDMVFMRHLGQVKLVVKPNGIEITWDSAHVTEDALESVCVRLSKCRNDIPVSLAFYFHGWSSGPALSPSQAVARINQVQMIRDVDVLYSTRIDEKPVSEALKTSSVIKSGFEAWRQSDGKFSNFSNEMLAEVLPSALIYHPDSKDRDIVFSWIGHRSFTMQMHGQKWGRGALGQPFDRPLGTEEGNYISRTSVAYEEVWETGEPRYQYIRTLFYTDGHDPEWLYYSRLLTRCILHDGTPALVCLSEPVRNESIPLPGTP